MKITIRIDGKVALQTEAEHFVEIGIDGYGEYSAEDGVGTPLVLDWNNGEPQVVVFGDINQEEPTHLIPLDEAKECCRKPAATNGV